MGIVTLDTGGVDVMFVGIDCFYSGARVLGVRQRGVTTQAQFPTGVDRKCFRVVRVVYGRPVAVFALDQPMLGTICLLNVFLMTFLTVVPAFIFDLELFPLIDIAQTVKTVGETFTVNPEIIRNYEVPDEQS
jgi:hypothetical protein